MNELVASRSLRFKNRNSNESGELVVEIYKPYLLKEGMVEFPVSVGNAGCSLRVTGLDTERYNDEIYGMDSLQAISMAVDVEGILKKISETYELFFQDGDPYFE